MAAVGLIPEYKIIPNDLNSARRLMTALIEFVRAMRVTLKNINENSYNNFMLRVGVNVGPGECFSFSILSLLFNGFFCHPKQLFPE
jgi:hypothetical protein